MYVPLQQPSYRPLYYSSAQAAELMLAFGARADIRVVAWLESFGLEGRASQVSVIPGLDGIMYIQTYGYIHICRYTDVHTHICMHTYMPPYILTYIHTHTYIRTYMHTYIHTYVHTYVRTYMNMYTHMYVCIYAYIFIHIYICISVSAHVRTFACLATAAKILVGSFNMVVSVS